MKSFFVSTLLITTITALPTDAGTSQLKARQASGSYTVSGLGSRKQAVLNAGGNTLDLAIAMLETYVILVFNAVNDG